MTDPIEQTLFSATFDNRVSAVLSLLCDHPGLNVNWENKQTHSWTALHFASLHDRIEVVKLLLAHPRINVNVRDKYRQTPFLLGCANGAVSVARLLLKDPRVDITLCDYYECTPLWKASCNGQLQVVEWLIASSKNLADLNKKGRRGAKEFSALEIAQENTQTGVELLEKFLDNPALTRHEICVKLGVLDELAAELYAITVFLRDDLLQIKPEQASSHPSATSAAANHFFAIASKLPMELQMVLCHRAVGSTKQNILHKDSEAVFNSLARILLLLSPQFCFDLEEDDSAEKVRSFFS